MSETHEQILRVLIRKPLADIFLALTDSDQLRRWFAEDAEIDLTRNIFNFWGRYTPETPDKNSGKHTVSDFEPNRLLEFDWKLRGAETTVRFDLEDSRDGVLLTVTHSDLPPRPDTQYSITDFWYAALENLRAWVERKAEAVFIDYTKVDRGRVKITAEIDVPGEVVWEALINPKQVDKIFMGKAEIEPKQGGKYTYGWSDDGPLKILEFEPNKKLALDWHYRNEERTVVSWELEGSGGRTRLTLVHSGFADDREMGDYHAGWTSFMTMIKGMLETGEEWRAPEKLGARHEVV